MEQNALDYFLEAVKIEKPSPNQDGGRIEIPIHDFEKVMLLCAKK